MKYTESIKFWLFMSYMVVITLIISILFGCAHFYFSDVLEEKAIQYEELVITSVNQSIESYLREFEQITLQIYHPEIHSLVNQVNYLWDGHSNWTYENTKNKMLAPFYIWRGSIQYNRDILSILFSDQHGEYYVKQGLIPTKSGLNLMESEVFKKTLNGMYKLTISVEDANKWFDISDKIKNEKIVIIGRKIVNTIRAKNLGLLFIVIDLDSITKSVNKLVGEQKGIFIILDEKEQVIFSTDPTKNDVLNHINVEDFYNERDAIEFDGEKYMLKTFKSSLAGWTYINLISYSEILKEIKNINKITYVFVIISLILSLLLSGFLARTILRPLYEMEEFAIKIEKGMLDTKLDIKSYKEFNHLAHVFNKMIVELKEIIRKNYIVNMERREAELKTLHAQINPHFLYNTLNSINYYAQIYQAQEIMDMTYALSDILRYSIKDISELVLIRDELMHIDNYLFLQNVRYNNEIKVIKKLDKDIMECKIIRFILQPLVENSIYHGFKDKEEDKVLEIVIQSCGDKIVLMVIDNGKGMEEEQLNKLREMIEANDFSCEDEYTNMEKGSIGIKNVNQRIKLIFGSEYGIQIQSKVDEGTCVKVTIPKIK